MLRFVGAGASGTVRAAVSLQTGEVVALTASRKQTPADDPGSEIAFGPWDAEIRRRYAVMAELRHPNLARIHEFFATANKFYAAMELAEGGNLESYVGRGKMLPETDIRVVLQAILDGLAYLHSHRIAHRDVKPANVLLRRQQDLSSVVPADFDGSFVSDGNETSPNMRTLVGTPFFLAPEIALGRPYGIPVDVYSAGCIAFYLACGRTPFENATSFDRLYHRISTGDWRFPKGATCRPPLRTSCGGCSRRTPQEGSQRRGHWTTRSSQRRGGG
ncbi:kinase-like domain-containing protein [Hyaloraphidium curvatum]|nr:kinase-like domain-containing protein [Hyaloraphidium curvatum]